MALSICSMAGKKRKLADLSVDEFMTGGFESSSSESEKQAKTKIKNKQKSKKVTKAKTSAKQGKSLKERLADQDPEFLEFLQVEDEALLAYEDDMSDSGDDSSKDDKIDDSNSDDDIDLPQSSDEDEIVEAILSKKKAKLANKSAKSKNEKATKSEKHDKAEKVKKDKRKKKDSDASSIDKTVVNGEKTNKQKKGNSKSDELLSGLGKELSNASEKKKKSKDKLLNADGIVKEPGSEKTKKGNKAKKEIPSKGSGDDDEDDGDYADEEDDDDNEWQEFDTADVSSDDSEDEEEGLHKVPDKLEVMSDSNDEDEDDVGDNAGPKKKSNKVKVTMKMIKEWTKRFKDMPSPAVIHDAVYAFKAAVQHTATEAVATKYSVEGSKVFNGVIRMCLVEIPAALHKILDLPETTDIQKAVLPSSKNNKWKKVRVDMKSYLADVLQLLTQLSEANMVNVLLKHVHKLVAFYACFPNLTKVMLKRVIGVWSTGEETSRVLAFLCINRLIRVQQQTLLETCLKQMYMAYVKNCKFTSPNTLPLINFMQRSLVEILSIDFTLAYQYAFIYIRQLAIHLRNAICTKKKESCQAVYNWQFVHCVGLWTRVMCMTHPNEVLEPLIYPLVQTIIGTIKLVPTQRYYPLRFHCVRALTMISRSTGTFIPVLPFLLEVLEQTDFNRKHKNVSFKPFNFASMLRFSKAQLQERAFKDGIIDQLYELMVEHMHAHAHTIGFPELALPTILQLKEFLKNCKVSNFTKQIRQIVEKVEENGRFITDRRRSVTISVADTQAVRSWERHCEDAGTPLGKFYSTWRKLRDRELMHQIANKDQIVGDDGLPEVKRRPKKATEEDKKEFSALFDSDSDDNVDHTDSFAPNKKKKASKKPVIDNDGASDDGNEDDGSKIDDDDADGDDDDVMDADDDEDDDISDDGEDDDEESEESDMDTTAIKDIVKEFSMSSDEED